jgi:hypothetical protein
VSAGLQEGYGFPNGLKNMEGSDKSLLINSSLSLMLPKLLQRASEILRYFIGSSTANSFEDAITFLYDLASSIEKHKPVGFMTQVSNIYSEFTPGLMDHFLNFLKADDTRNLALVTSKIKESFFSQYWKRVEPELEKKVKRVVSQLIDLHARESIIEILGRDINGEVEIRMMDCFPHGPAYSAYPAIVYLPPAVLESNKRELLPCFAHEFTHLVLRNAKIFRKEAIAKPIEQIRKNIFPSLLDVAFEVILVEHPLCMIVEEKIRREYNIPLPDWWEKVNIEDFSSICGKEMRGRFLQVWSELQNVNSDEFARLIGEVLEKSRDKLIAIFSSGKST